MLFGDFGHALVGLESIQSRDPFGIVVIEVDPRSKAEFEDRSVCFRQHPAAQYLNGLRIPEAGDQYRIHALCVHCEKVTTGSVGADSNQEPHVRTTGPRVADTWFPFDERVIAPHYLEPCAR